MDEVIRMFKEFIENAIVEIIISHYKRKIKKQEVTKFTGCRWNGQLITSFAQYHQIMRKEMKEKGYLIIDSDQGKILAIHGCPNGKVSHFGHRYELSELSAHLGLFGQFHLVSCFNSTREDWSFWGTSFIRVPSTIKDHPAMLMPMGNGIMCGWSDPILSLQYGLTSGNFKRIKQGLGLA